jgi:hypothetical protein
MPKRRRPANLGDGIGYFLALPDHAFAAWLAGFFDGEGSVYLSTGQPTSIAVSIGNTNRDIVESIARRVGIGSIETRLQKSLNWNTTYIWRVRTFAGARTVLLLMRPYLTIKAEDADRALRRIAVYAEKRQRIETRNAEICALAATGKHTITAIAKRFGMHRSWVSMILTAWRKERIA